MERLRTRKTAHPKGSDTRSLLSCLSKNFDSKGLLIVKAMLGKTLQEKQEDRALTTGRAETGSNRRDGGGVYLRDVIISQKVRARPERGRKLVGETKNQKD